MTPAEAKLKLLGMATPGVIMPCSVHSSTSFQPGKGLTPDHKSSTSEGSSSDGIDVKWLRDG
jgi:hypothetical protein